MIDYLEYQTHMKVKNLLLESWYMNLNKNITLDNGIWHQIRNEKPRKTGKLYLIETIKKIFKDYDLQRSKR